MAKVNCHMCGWSGRQSLLGPHLGTHYDQRRECLSAQELRDKYGAENVVLRQIFGLVKDSRGSILMFTEDDGMWTCDDVRGGGFDQYWLSDLLAVTRAATDKWT